MLRRHDGQRKPVFTKFNVSETIDPTLKQIEDDHKPFYEAGMKRILHMIDVPFPEVWHKMGDNAEALDMATIHYLNKLVQLIVYGYLEGESRV